VVSQFAGILLLMALAAASIAPAQMRYLGFDRNDYPGDANLPALRQTFRYTGYWLNIPPGDSQNTWAGKRALLKRYGFGFLVLFNGRTDAELKGRDAATLGKSDGDAAVGAAKREGFKPNVLIFLDQEEGGRLLPEQAAYILAWIDAVHADGARAGVYCSGIPVRDISGTISTAEDIAQRLAGSSKRAARLWIFDDRCPPSPGCSVTPPLVGLAFRPQPPAILAVWQYAQSPRRAEFSASCPQNQAPDGNCYAPGLPPGSNTFVDLNVTGSPDPSEGP
jgi:hypothetical protein